jgi:glycine dehydrogenase subunit 1
MDVANASVYDGGSGIAEAVNLAFAKTGKKKVLLSSAINPLYREVVKTYTDGRGFELCDIPLNADGSTDIDALNAALDDSVCAFVLQNPNFFGIIEDGFAFGDVMSKSKAMFITSCDPVSLWYADSSGSVWCGYCYRRSAKLGNRMNYGGPLLGFFASRKENVRLMPGRIVGLTKDADGNDGLVLTYQTREQHIRREKATSNICSNQALLALCATVYLSLLGDEGL